MKKRFLFAVTMLLSSVLGAMAAETGQYFKYDPALYNQSTVVYATLVKADGTQFTDNDGTYYIGAFIDDVCRAEATSPQRVMDPNSGELLGIAYVLRVGGSDADAGKIISFRVLKVNDQLPTVGGDEFEPTTKATYSADATVGMPSQPFQIQFTPATGITLPAQISLHRNATINMLEQITVTPDGSLLPIADPVWDYANSASYVSMEGNVLTALQITGNDMGGAYVGVNIGSLSAYTYVVIDAPAESATWDEEYASGITLNVGEQLTEDVIARHFTTDPKDATTRFTWTSGDETIMAPADVFAGFTAMKAGKTTLTARSANDDSQATLSLDVTVVQPVTAIWLGDTENANPAIVVQVGDNVSERLAQYINMQPANATNKNYTIEIGENNTSLTKNATGNVIASKAWDYLDRAELTKNTVSIVAADGSDVRRTVTIYVVEVQPTAVGVQKSTIYLTKPANEDRPDCTAALVGNLTLTPAGLNIADFSYYFDFGQSKLIVETGEDQNAKPLYAIAGVGQCTANVTVNALDYLNATFENGVISIDNKQLTTTFNIVIREGLSSFTFADVAMTRENTYQLTLTPDPADAEFDPNLLSINIVPEWTEKQHPMTSMWTYVDAKKDESDAKGLTYTLSAQSIGNGTIYINYGGEQMGQGNIAVYQQLELANGWQWVAICQNTIANFNAAFGANLDEARSQEQLVYNDPKVGYFGDLSVIDPLKAYKVKMKDLEGSKSIIVNTLIDGASYFDYAAGIVNANIPLRAGWNWIGAPYQYSRDLNDAFGKTKFTEGDILKGKNAFAEYTSGGWTGDLTALEPGEGYLLKVQNRGALSFTPEFEFGQFEMPAPARNMQKRASLFDIDGSRFADNMSMVAEVNAVSDASRCTVYAFVGDECRGQGVNVDGRQFITVHGNIGEQVSFRIYDELTGQFYECNETQKLLSVSGSTKAPVALNAGNATNAIDRVSTVAKRIAFDGSVLDLRGLNVKRLQVVNAGGVEMVSGNEALTDLSQLPSGIYMIIVETAEGQHLTKKIVK